MNEFFLYYSGIIIGKLDFEKGNDIFYFCSIENGKWSNEPNRLNPPFGNDFLETIEFDLYGITQNFNKYREVFSSVNSGKIKAPWGEVYYKEGNMLYARETKNGIDVLFENNNPIAFISASLFSTVVLIKSGYETCSIIAEWSNENISKPESSIEQLGTYMVPMRDGVKLATHVWIPQNHSEKVPTVLIRTPYNAKESYYYTFQYVRRGYAVVLQDVRGREQSEGEFYGISGEIDDGDDTLNWIASQQWSDGKVGTIGASYCGYVQWAMAASGNEHLKCMVSMVTAGPPFGDFPRPGGTLLSGILPWIYAMSSKNLEKDCMEKILTSDWETIFKIRPIKDIPQKAFGREIECWSKWIENEPDNEYWSHWDWTKYREKIKAAALIQTGWFDDDAVGSQCAWDIAKNFEKGQSFLMIGPWLHGGNSTRDVLTSHLSNDSIIYNIDIFWQEWFDSHLKSQMLGDRFEQKVLYYSLGENEWKKADAFPPEEFAETKLFFSHNGELMPNAEESSGGVGFVYDPNNPTPHVFDPSENEMGVPGDYTDVEKRDDVVCFTYSFDNDVEVAGNVVVEFYASSSAPDTDWVVRVTAVDEEGRSSRLTGAIIRAKFRNGFDKADLLTPYKSEKYVLKLPPFARKFCNGEKLRVHIASAADGLTFPNYNTGEALKDEVKGVKAEQMIFWGKKYPSNLTIYTRKL